ncbi:MAG: hypothetical protein ABI386_07360 [Rhodanobacter sp.]
MFLRRVTANFRKQDWTAVVVELAVVVVGVFIGMQVTNWNDARIERSQEKSLLLQLHQDFEESVAGQSRDLRFIDRQLSDQAVILKSLDTCSVTPTDSEAFQRGISTLGYINPPRLSRRTIDGMETAGKTDIIQNEAIKNELAGIIAMAEWRKQGFDQVARDTEHYRYIVEGLTRYAPARIYRDEFLGDFIGVDFDIRALCAEPTVASAISAISNFTLERSNAYRPLLERYRNFLCRCWMPNSAQVGKLI